jgi:hypothetical protein
MKKEVFICILFLFLLSCAGEEQLTDEELFDQLEELDETELAAIESEDDSALAGQAFGSSRQRQLRGLRKAYQKASQPKCKEIDGGVSLTYYSGRTKTKVDKCSKSREKHYKCDDKKKRGYSWDYVKCESGCENAVCISPCPEGEYFLEQKNGVTICGQCLQDNHCVDQFGEGYYCVDGSCAPPDEEELFDYEGRLTEYSRSLAPETLVLNLDKLPKLFPENYGNNYFDPGTYSIHVGDGFGKGDFLIKFMEFDVDNGRIVFEVFKKERDGNYYHFPTDVNENFIYKYKYNQQFDMPIEIMVGSSTRNPLDATENILIYHPSCEIFFDYCKDENSEHYATDSESCNWRCPFESNNDEIKIQEGIFSVTFPEGYETLADFSVGLLEQCYNNNIEFLGYNQEKSRIGIKVLLSNSGGPATGHDEYIGTKKTVEQLEGNINILNLLTSEKEGKRCSNYLNLGHELTHTLTKEILGNNYGLNEGLADFVSFQNGFEKEYVCVADGWRLTFERPDTSNNYVSLSTNPGETSSSPSKHYYGTGFCFWNDFTKEYGYLKFVEVMQQLYYKSRGTDDYYVLDVMEDVLRKPISAQILNRYSLNREATFVKICNNCEIFTQ